MILTEQSVNPVTWPWISGRRWMDDSYWINWFNPQHCMLTNKITSIMSYANYFTFLNQVNSDKWKWTFQITCLIFLILKNISNTIEKRHNMTYALSVVFKAVCWSRPITANILLCDNLRVLVTFACKKGIISSIKTLMTMCRINVAGSAARM